MAEAKPLDFIKNGTDLKKLSESDILLWLQEHRIACNTGERDLYRAWQEASAYLAMINAFGADAVTKAIIGEKIELNR